MVNQSVKVFARLKTEERSKAWQYEICRTRKGDCEDLLLYGNYTKTGLFSKYKFRFQKIFDQQSQQSSLFEKVAKPVINSVLEGFNGTIFAYGQTGSGKTYTITGSPKNYNDRGIIPRSIQYIFAHNEKVSDKPAVCISYMEIYNENGYDLLGTKIKTAHCLEELPRIIILDDKKGEYHIRNLSILPVSTEEEAMRLLFLGDTNRTIAETPSNEYSSRSHCIFTVYLTYTNTGSGKVKFSKLHLVDLAGSERVHKSLTTGVALSEAKFINLSLHYLQQVILALSDQKRSHIPYRNSMMTNLLKDSLCGNCLTVMIANLNINRISIPETLSTCKFAQRVSLLKTEPVINEVSNSVEEIVYLKNKVKELEEKLASLTNLSVIKDPTKLDNIQLEYYGKMMETNTGHNGDAFPKNDLSELFIYLNFLKEEINSQKKLNDEQQLISDQQQTEIENLRKNIEEKDSQIHSLKQYIDNIPEKDCEPGSSRTSDRFLYQNKMDPSQKEKLFDVFLTQSDKGKELTYYRKNLKRNLDIAKLLSQTLEQCQENILYIRRKLETCTCHSVKTTLITELEEQQVFYRKSLEDLKTIKNETARFEFGLKQTEIKTNLQFSKWLKQTSLNTFMSEKYNCCPRSDATNFPEHFKIEEVISVHEAPSFVHEETNSIQEEAPSVNEKITPFHGVAIPNSSLNYQNNSQFCGDFPYHECKSCTYLSPYPLASTSGSLSEIPFKSLYCKNSKSNYQCCLSNTRSKHIVKKVSSCDICIKNKCSNDEQSYFDEQSRCPEQFECSGNVIIPQVTSSYPRCRNSQDTCRLGNNVQQNIHIDSANIFKTNSNDTISVSSNTNEEYFTLDNSKTTQCKTGQDHTRSIKYGINPKDSRRRMLFPTQLDTIPEIEQIESRSSIDENYRNTAKVKISMASADNSSKKQYRQHRKTSIWYNKENIANLCEDENKKNGGARITTQENINGKENDAQLSICDDLFQSGDSDVFKEFVNTLQLTGDVEIDREIVNFYRTKFV